MAAITRTAAARAETASHWEVALEEFVGKDGNTGTTLKLAKEGQRYAKFNFGPRTWQNLFATADKDGDSCLFGLFSVTHAEAATHEEADAVLKGMLHAVEQFQAWYAERYEETAAAEVEEQEAEAEAAEEEQEHPYTTLVAGRLITEEYTSITGLSREELLETMPQDLQSIQEEHGVLPDTWQEYDVFMAGTEEDVNTLVARKKNRAIPTSEDVARISKMLATQTRIWRESEPKDRPWLVGDAFACTEGGLSWEEYRDGLRAFPTIAAYKAHAEGK